MKNYKENLILIIGMMIILGTHLVSCCKVPVPPVVVVEPELKPVIEFTATPSGVIPWGDTLEINVKTINSKSLWVNDQKQPSALESKIRTGLYNDTIFVFKAKNITLSSEKELEVKVGHWTESVSGLLSYHYWNRVSLRVWRGDTLLAHFDFNEDQKSNLYYFRPNGKIEIYNKDGKMLSSEWWSLDKDKKNILLGVNKEIFWFEVDENSLTMRNEDTYPDGLPCVVETIFTYCSL